MSKAIVIADADADAATLELAPISPDWILSGKPEARNKLLARSRTVLLISWFGNAPPAASNGITMRTKQLL